MPNHFLSLFHNPEVRTCDVLRFRLIRALHCTDNFKFAYLYELMHYYILFNLTVYKVAARLVTATHKFPGCAGCSSLALIETYQQLLLLLRLLMSVIIVIFIQ